MPERQPTYLSNHQIGVISRKTTDLMQMWIHQSNMPPHSERWFMCARDEAFKSNFHTVKIGCAIVYKSKLIGKGHNQLKTDPYQKRYNQKYRVWTNEPDFSKTCGHTLHAEIDALKNIPHSIMQKIVWKKVEVYVYRVAPGLEGYSGLALPCQACAHALSDLGITTVYYTTGRLDKPFGCCDL